MILSWLAHSVALDLTTIVVFTSIVHEVWEDLRQLFAQRNTLRIQKSIASHEQGTSSIDVCFTKLKSYWDELSIYRPPSSSRHPDVEEIEKTKRTR
ncbi:hypothetical protein Patl1_05258 [Pistacia atlantica]|uniref:Uncharacterized protein n=1 Tax=Pistacia atlantica TaxID=434234 RepID=A0ACC1BPF2_9ROSI|nr:hypothetical protein Patl1_05258 [Pistacia atlantica]